MPQPFMRRVRMRFYVQFIIMLCVCALAGASLTVRAQGQTPPPAAVSPTPGPLPSPTPAAGTPSRVVLDFYHALRERQFREAFALSIYKPAITGLSAQEFDELRPEFEKLSTAVPDAVELGGEQISGDEATVFARRADDPTSKVEQIQLIRVGGVWLYGDLQSYQAVQSKGAAFFPDARIDRHHDEVQQVLILIAQAEAAYAAQHGGVYADVPTLVASKPSLHSDIESDTLGYNFRVLLGKDGRTYAVTAEPVKYGRTGRLSFYMDATGYKNKDTGGKPYTPPGVKKP